MVEGLDSFHLSLRLLGGPIGVHGGLPAPERAGVLQRLSVDSSSANSRNHVPDELVGHRNQSGHLRLERSRRAMASFVRAGRNHDLVCNMQHGNGHSEHSLLNSGFPASLCGWSIGGRS